MLGRLARGAFLLAIAVMFAVWALSLGRDNAEPHGEPQVWQLGA